MSLAARLADLADPLSRPAAPPLTLVRLAPEAWDAAIAGFDDVCQEQLMVFAAARWPGVVQEPLLFMEGDTVAGGCLVMVQPLPLKLGAIAVAKWAPMLARANRPDALLVYSRMIDLMVAEYAKRRGMMLSVLPRAALGERNDQYEHLTGRGFRVGAKLLFPDRYIVNLKLSDEEQRRSLHQKWRYHLNRADRAGLSFERAEPSRRPEFDALYHQMVDRKKFPDHSAYDTVPALLDIADPALRPELFFVRHGREVVAGAVIFKAGDRAVYLYGATSAHALELRAGYFLHWHIIRWLRDNTAARWYDLGGTDGFQGLHQFKKGMVGDRGIIAPVPPVANYAARLWPRLIGEAAFAGREIAHQLGRQLDRLRPDRANPNQQRAGGQEGGHE
jgi:hypothetical protein